MFSRLRNFALAAAMAMGLVFVPHIASATTAPIVPCTITTAGTPVRCFFQTGTLPSAGVLYGAYNNSATPQTATITCIDATSYVGSTYALVLAPMGASQSISLPATGKAVKLGLWCEASGSGSLTGMGVDIYVATQ